MVWTRQFRSSDVVPDNGASSVIVCASSSWCAEKECEAVVSPVCPVFLATTSPLTSRGKSSLFALGCELICLCNRFKILCDNYYRRGFLAYDRSSDLIRSERSSSALYTVILYVPGVPAYVLYFRYVRVPAPYIYLCTAQRVQVLRQYFFSPLELDV